MDSVFLLPNLWVAELLYAVFLLLFPYLLDQSFFPHLPRLDCFPHPHMNQQTQTHTPLYMYSIINIISFFFFVRTASGPGPESSPKFSSPFCFVTIYVSYTLRRVVESYAVETLRMVSNVGSSGGSMLCRCSTLDCTVVSTIIIMFLYTQKNHGKMQD